MPTITYIVVVYLIRSAAVSDTIEKMEGLNSISKNHDHTEFEVEFSVPFDGQDQAFLDIQTAIKNIPGVKSVRKPSLDE